MTFYNIGELKQRVHTVLLAGDTCLALDLVRDAVDTVINNKRSVAKILASRDLDCLCADITKHWRENKAETVPCKNVEGTVILATELALAGGHVELIKDYIRCGEFPKPVTLVLSDCFDRANSDLSAKFSQALDTRVVTIRGQNSGHRLEELDRTLHELSPRKILLVNHNQDSVAIVAALAQSEPEVFFIHHADHHLCLGVTREEFIHVDVAQYAYCNCRDRLKNSQNRYWPIILQGKFSARSPGFDLSKGLTTCAVGRSEKFEAGEYSYDYFKIIPEVLAATGGSHVHIGPLDDNRLEGIRAQLTDLGVDAASFRHVPWVSSVADAMIDYSVDVYMVSFPYGGAKSAIEAMATGIPVLVHKNYRSILTSSYFVVYDDAYAWGNPDELISLLKSVSADDLYRHSRQSRDFYEKNYTLEILNSAIRKREGWESESPNFKSYYVDGLQAYLDEERLIDEQSGASTVKVELSRMYEEYSKIHTEYLSILDAYNRLLSVSAQN